MKNKTILKSTAIFTGLEKTTIDGYVIVENNYITHVGNGFPSDKELSDADFLDFGNKLIMAGFSDAHTHFFVGASALSDYCCWEIADSTSEKECVEMLKNFYAERPFLDKIRGMGWFPAKWGDTLPSKESLDEAFPDIPVYLNAADGHTHWLNTCALKECGITGDYEIAFGEIGKNEKGELNGLLFEMDANKDSTIQIMTYPPDIAKEVYSNFFHNMVQFGVTSVADMAVTPTIDGDLSRYEILKEMEDEDNLFVRINIYPSMGITGDFTKAHEMKKKYNSPKYQLCGLKQYFDGVTSTYTAALSEPYTDNPDTCGYMNFSEEDYEKCMIKANKEGFGLRIHALGDKAVNTALNIFEKSKEVNENYSSVRNSIEHIENINPTDYPRFKQLDVTASVQPLHLAVDENEKITRIGIERCKDEFPLKSLIDSGARLALGTDMPVISLNPFENIYAGLTRCDLNGNPTGANPEQKISLADSLIAYTYGSAYSHKRDHELGTLESGKLADIIVIDNNLFDSTAEEIKNSKVIFTMVDGQVVYTNK